MNGGWHFVAEDRRLGYGDGRLVRIGETLTVDCEPVLCKAGLHAGYTAYDALQYAQGPVLCRVQLGGTIVRGDNKAAGTARTVLKMADVSHVLHEFACRCAEDALALIDNPDPRSVAAIETKRRWLRGEASDNELAAAGTTARDAVREAAREAARADARVAARTAARVAARTAAWDAARTAAWAASRDAAWEAAREAARADARDAARDAVRAAAWAVQKRRLAAMLGGVEWET